MPNLTIYAARAQLHPLTAYIRGIGQADPLWGFDPGAGIYLDDVTSRVQGALLDVFDVGAVEVLRGPQGAVRLKEHHRRRDQVHLQALPAGHRGYASVTLGNYSERDVKTGIGGASADGVWRARRRRLPHPRRFRQNLLTGEGRERQGHRAVRASVGYFPSAQFNAQLSLDAMNDDSNVRGAKRLALNPLRRGQDAANRSDFDVQNGMPNVNATDLRGSSLVMNFLPGGDWSFKSVTAWRSGDTDTNIDF